MVKVDARDRPATPASQVSRQTARVAAFQLPLSAWMVTRLTAKAVASRLSSSATLIKSQMAMAAADLSLKRKSPLRNLNNKSSAATHLTVKSRVVSSKPRAPLR